MRRTWVRLKQEAAMLLMLLHFLKKELKPQYIFNIKHNIDSTVVSLGFLKKSVVMNGFQATVGITWTSEEEMSSKEKL